MEKSKHNIIPSLDASTADICFCKPHESKYGKCVFINNSFESKDAIKQLEWEKTYRRWRPDMSMWEIDIDGFAYAVSELSESGYSIDVTKSCVSELSEHL